MLVARAREVLYRLKIKLTKNFIEMFLDKKKNTILLSK